jgi:hypothetical protein
VTVDTVVNSGPGLVFITYPEVVLKLPGGSIWAIIFFFMLVVRNPPHPEVVLKLLGGSIWAINFFFMLVVRPTLPSHPVSDAVCFTGDLQDRHSCMSQKHFSRGGGDYNLDQL